MASTGVTLSPRVAAVLMSASTIIVALNAQLLRRVDLRVPPSGDLARRERRPLPAGAAVH